MFIHGNSLLLWWKKQDCYLFEHQEWVGWEKVVKNFDNIKYEEYFDAESTPNLNNYTFSVVIDGVENRVKYWELEGTVSVHGWVNGQGCLCGFDQYHQKVVKDLLCEKFDFMKEIMGRSANRL